MNVASNSHAKASTTLGKLPSLRFNIMVVGEPNSGKRTFLQSLFSKYVQFVFNDNALPPPPTWAVDRSTSFNLPSEACDCLVSICSSHDNAFGFGHDIDRRASIQQVKNFVWQQHKHWLQLDANSMREEVIRKNRNVKRYTN